MAYKIEPPYYPIVYVRGYAMTVCAVAFIASVVGPQRVQRLVVPVGFKAGLAGLALIVGTVVYMLYCWLTL